MTNVFMEEFKKRLIKALMVGGAFVLFMVLSPLFTDESPFANMSWALVPVVLILTVFYGTGWYFAFNLIKKAWRKFLRVNRDATIIQALTGRGLIIGFTYSIICLVVGSFLSFIVGNYFMVRDYLLAKNGQPPMSVKYKFDSDKEYDSWVSTVRGAVEYNEIANGASDEVRAENEKALRNIENGYADTVTTYDEDKKKEKKTTFI